MVPDWMLDPIRCAVSDYGWTRYTWGYRAMVLLQGSGAILIAIGLAQETDATELVWLLVYGVVRLLISGFMTDREPESMRSLTRTGAIHILLAGTAFASIAVASSRIHWTGEPGILGCGRSLVVLGLARVGTAPAALLRQGTIGIERVLEAHGSQLCLIEREPLGGGR